MTPIDALRELADYLRAHPDALSPGARAYFAQLYADEQRVQWAAERPGQWVRANVTDRNRRIGEHHPRAKLSDADVELIHELRAEELSYRKIAAKFEVSPSTVRDIVKLRRRAATVMGSRLAWRDPVFAPAHPDEFEVCA